MVNNMDLSQFKTELIGGALFLLLSTETTTDLIKSMANSFSKDGTPFFSEDKKSMFQINIIKAFLMIMATMLLRRWI